MYSVCKCSSEDKTISPYVHLSCRRHVRLFDHSICHRCNEPIIYSFRVRFVLWLITFFLTKLLIFAWCVHIKPLCGRNLYFASAVFLFMPLQVPPGLEGLFGLVAIILEFDLLKSYAIDLDKDLELAPTTFLLDWNWFSWPLRWTYVFVMFRIHRFVQGFYLSCILRHFVFLQVCQVYPFIFRPNTFSNKQHMEVETEFIIKTDRFGSVHRRVAVERRPY